MAAFYCLSCFASSAGRRRVAATVPRPRSRRAYALRSSRATTRRCASRVSDRRSTDRRAGAAARPRRWRTRCHGQVDRCARVDRPSAIDLVGDDRAESADDALRSPARAAASHAVAAPSSGGSPALGPARLAASARRGPTRPPWRRRSRRVRSQAPAMPLARRRRARPSSADRTPPCARSRHHVAAAARDRPSRSASADRSPAPSATPHAPARPRPAPAPAVVVERGAGDQAPQNVPAGRRAGPRTHRARRRGRPRALRGPGPQAMRARLTGQSPTRDSIA